VFLAQLGAAADGMPDTTAALRGAYKTLIWVMALHVSGSAPLRILYPRSLHAKGLGSVDSDEWLRAWLSQTHLLEHMALQKMVR
jgi:hypothetical protein